MRIFLRSTYISITKIRQKGYTSMSIAKVARFYREYGLTRTISKTVREGRRALSNLSKIKIRTCMVCARRSVFARTHDTQEAEICLRCGANLRYEMLAQ